MKHYLLGETMGHTIGDTAFLHNGAAKDDVVAPAGLTLDTSVLLANDPGSAKFIGFYDPSSPNAALSSIDNGGITYDPTTHKITFNDPTVTGFDYIIQVGNNGTYSVAHVTLTPHLGAELLQNWSFENPAVPAGDSWIGASSLPGWGSDAGGHALEVISNAYLGAGMTGGDPARQSLDTQASPGGVSIEQVITDFSGGHIQLSVSVAAEQVVANGVTYETTPGSVLTISWNHHAVMTVTEDSFRDPVTHAINYDSFKTFTVEVDAHGSDTLGISDSGTGFAGYALDWASTKEWIV